MSQEIMSKDEMFAPLEKYTPEEIWDSMMFMGTYEDIYLYKHCDTRQYINIDKEGNFYNYVRVPSYIKIDKKTALDNLKLSLKDINII